MTEVQINYILAFFSTNNNRIDSRNIARRLVTDGSCIVGGDRIIWYGSSSTFIRTDSPNGQYNCFTYTFDLEGFLASDTFAQEKTKQLKMLQDQMGKTLEEFNQIQLL